jgi:hypothetical protein
MPSLSSIAGAVTDTGRNVKSLSNLTGYPKKPFINLGDGAKPVSLQQNIALAAFDNESPDINQSNFDPFWIYPQIELKRWNKLYPYQLLALQANTDDQGKTSYLQISGFQFTLPFPPESLSVNMPFASVVEATLGGIVEQNNGAPFRDIQLSGSLGVLAGRGSAPPYRTPGSVQQIIGGMVNLGANITADIQNVSRAFSGQAPLGPYTYTDDDFDDEYGFSKKQDSQAMVALSTGYYQLKQLEKFLEAYANAKKSDSSLRLAWADWKNYRGMVTLVTPLQFNYRKVASSPMEYTYTLYFRGWKRTPLNTGTKSDISLGKWGDRLTKFLRILNTLEAAAILLEDLKKIPQTIMGSYNTFKAMITEPVRQARVHCKIELGETLSLADLPEDLEVAVYSSYVKAFDKGQKVGNPGKAFSRASIGSPANTFAQKNAISINSLSPSSSNMAAIQQEKSRIANLKRHDFQGLRDLFAQGVNQILAALNAGSSTVAATYGLSQPLNTHRDEPSDSDWEVIWALEDSLQALDTLVANLSNKNGDSPVVDSMVQLTRRLGVAFNKPVSKFAVPMPYRISLEQLAQLYLGNPDRWIEIAVLNGLKPPYIDEVGFELPLLVNGSGNQVTINQDERLYVNQPIWLGSNGSATTRHHITNIKQVGQTLVLTLDGETLELYKVRDQAYLQAFLPDTTNSQSLIYMPSDQPPLDENSIVTTEIPGIDKFDSLVPVGGIDFQLDSDNNLVIINGDARYIGGLQNIVQWTRVFLAVPLGHLQLHQAFGIAAQVGDSTADVESKSIASSIRNSLVGSGLFSSIDKVSVSKKGPTAAINVSASIFGYTSPIAIGYEVQR